jgi:hypothetical protein
MQEMIKHIKKKTFDNFKLNEVAIEKIKETVPEALSLNFKGKIKYKKVKNSHALLFLESNETIRAFFYNDNGNTCMIPLANPVLIYFHSAQTTLRGIYSTKKELLGLFREDTVVTESSLKLFYDFFGQTSGFVTLLLTAVEAFVNQNIPEDFEYKQPEGNKFTRLYNHEQIQRRVSLEEKIENILNVVSKKNFAAKYPNRNIHLTNLKRLRDDIVHTKSVDHYESYTKLFKETLNFKFNETIEAIKDFINFYEPDLIEPCPCGLDF